MVPLIRRFAGAQQTVRHTEKAEKAEKEGGHTAVCPPSCSGSHPLTG